MQRYRDGEVAYSEVFQDEDGMFRAGKALIFPETNSQVTPTEEISLSSKASIESWARWMRSQGHEVFELPRTIRTRDWGLTFSVTARGEDSRIFVISQEH